MKSKHLFSLLLAVTLTTTAVAQTDVRQQTITSSIPNKDAKFLLFPTRNNFIFLKLNTSNGEVYLVQFSLDMQGSLSPCLLKGGIKRKVLHLPHGQLLQQPAR